MLLSHPRSQQIKQQFFRFYSIGFITSGTCWVLYEILYYMEFSREFHEASAWAVSYTITSFLSHFLHHRLTFSSNREYWASLWRTLFVYLCAMVLSTICAHYFTTQGVSHRLMWVINMSGFGLLNFFFLRWYAYEDVFSTSEIMVRHVE